VAVRVFVRLWTILDVAVEIETLRVAEIRVRNAGRLGCPVGRDKPSQPVGVISCLEVVQARFSVAFFAGEFVMTACTPLDAGTPELSHSYADQEQAKNVQHKGQSN
jgi:hypothetical protein